MAKEQIFRQVLTFERIKLLVVQQNDYIIKITYNLNNQYGINATTDLIRDLQSQLEAYFAGNLKIFTIPLLLIGTEFQKTVWRHLQEIPYGETRTYQQIATMCGNPKACRAVGFANNQNPISIVIPCHRVIGANGKLVGYAGGLDIKQFLLEIETENRIAFTVAKNNVIK
jgi:methylated-DNA-[protein]-cysteine S-methyltransferase